MKNSLKKKEKKKGQKLRSPKRKYNCTKGKAETAI